MSAYFLVMFLLKRTRPFQVRDVVKIPARLRIPLSVLFGALALLCFGFLVVAAILPFVDHEPKPAWAGLGFVALDLCLILTAAYFARKSYRIFTKNEDTRGRASPRLLRIVSWPFALPLLVVISFGNSR